MEYLIVDDDFNSRGGMNQTLKSHYPDSTIREACSLAEAISILAAHRQTRLVLLDLNLDDSRGLATLKALKHWCEQEDCNPRVVVVSAAADYDDSLVPQAIEHCATGFIAKGESEEVFRSAVELTLAGSIFIPERYLRARIRRPQPAVSDVRFTPRERQVAELLVKGLTYKQIARRLQGEDPGHLLSDATVRVHVQRMAWKIRTSDPESAPDEVPAKAVVVAYLAANGAGREAGKR
jgi:DNA-binding NarL/FixJ family response regulator